MRIIAIDPGSKKIGYLIIDGKEVIDKGLIPYKDFKYEFNSILMIFKPEFCILEKGGIPNFESKIKRVIGNKRIPYIEYESSTVREKLGLYDVGINNQNKHHIIKKLLGFKEYNRDIMDATLLVAYHYKLKGEPTNV